MTETYYGVGSFLFEVIKVFVLALVIIVPIRVFLFQPFFVQGQSMEPNFSQGEYLIVNEFGYKQTKVKIGSLNLFTLKPFRELERGDVVVFRYPRDPSQFFIKRVIGLPGERIELRKGEVALQSKDGSFESFVLDEVSYLGSGAETSGTVSLEMGDGEYFVMGDNRGHSHDSRSWGVLGEEFVIGKVLLRAWPVTEFGVFLDHTKIHRESMLVREYNHA